MITASPDTPLKDVEARLKGIEGLPVVDAAGKVHLLACRPAAARSAACSPSQHSMLYLRSSR